MFTGITKEDVPVLYQITGLSKYGKYFKLNSGEYSNFPNEKEVLLITGLRFNII